LGQLQHIRQNMLATAGAVPSYSIQQHLRQHTQQEAAAALFGSLAVAMLDATAHVPGLPPPVLLGFKR
jgi:hypothetical protein